MMIVGIDPGKSGAIFVYDPDIGCNVVGDVPTMKLQRAGKSPKEVPDFPQWRNTWLPLLRMADHVVIEQVTGSIGTGAQAGMFNFGYSAGFVLALVLEAGKPYTFMTPQAWKKQVGLKGSDGEASRRMASRLLPSCAALWPLKKHDGRAEAALMALAVTRVIEGRSSDNATHDGQRDHPSPASSAKRGKPKGGRKKVGD
jgi:crossover junction endodeoxyribonuclease RuvC